MVLMGEPVVSCCEAATGAAITSTTTRMRSLCFVFPILTILTVQNFVRDTTQLVRAVITPMLFETVSGVGELVAPVSGVDERSMDGEA
jgi:hypothetical protein